jgi:hypothetical protein
MSRKKWLLFCFGTALSMERVVSRLLYEDLGMDQQFVIQPMQTLRDQHILMVGDSLMRYQYLSLAHLLSKGEFRDKSDPEGKFLRERAFPTWMDFYKFTNEMLVDTVSGSELCDCHRLEDTRDSPNMTENRYFRDYQNNVSLTYIQYFGDLFPLRGHYSPRHSSAFRSNAHAGELLEASAWSYDSVQHMLTDYATKLLPAPTVLLMNAGFHRQNYTKPAHREAVLSVTRSHFPRFIWKTTNARVKDVMSPPAPTVLEPDALICATPGIHCMNLNWTYYLTPKDFVDFVHFQPYIYTDINMHFLRMLEHPQSPVYSALPSSYVDSIFSIEEGEHRGKSYLVDSFGRLQPLPDLRANGSSSGCVSEKFNSLRAHHARGANWLTQYVAGPSLALPDVCEGDLVRAASEKSIFLIQDAHRREFASWPAFTTRGFDLDQVKVVPDSSQFELYTPGERLGQV